MNRFACCILLGLILLSTAQFTTLRYVRYWPKRLPCEYLQDNLFNGVSIADLRQATLAVASVTSFGSIASSLSTLAAQWKTILFYDVGTYEITVPVSEVHLYDLYNRCLDQYCMRFYKERNSCEWGGPSKYGMYTCIMTCASNNGNLPGFANLNKIPGFNDL